MRNRVLALSIALALVGLASCNRSHDQASSGNDYSRIVCVSKQLNEIIFALGAGNRVVGVDLTSVYPPETAKLPKVGYHRLLNAEGIISLKPTVVIHDGNVAPAAVLTQLKMVGIPVREFPEAHTLDDTKQLIRSLGAELNEKARADSLCLKLDADMKLAEEQRKQYNYRPKVVLIHFGQQMNMYMAVGQKSTATSMIDWAGGINAIDVPQGMKPISPEMIAKAQPDIIFATDFGYDKAGGLENFKKLPGIALTPAAQHNRIYRVEEHDIIYLGPRTGENVLKLMADIFKR